MEQPSRGCRRPLCNVLAAAYDWNWRSSAHDLCHCHCYDAINQMKDAEKKDVMYLAHYMEEVINEFDLFKMNTNIFSFTGPATFRIAFIALLLESNSEADSNWNQKVMRSIVIR
jgi:hypothetical protein